MATERRISVLDIVKHFEKLEDPRSTINRLHPLPSVLVIAVLAVLAGCNGPTAIAQWAVEKKEFLLAVLDLPHGLPSRDVIRRVLALVRPQAFQACFTEWLQTLRDRAAAATPDAQPIFNVDGKAHRRSHDRKHGLGALHSVSVWASDYGLSLGQVACAEKSNEITAIPELLRLVDIEGAIITIDAMGTQKAIAAQIIDQKADYVLALKGNQETIHQSVIDYLGEQLEQDFAGVDARQWVTHEHGHGREEIRSYLHLPAPKDLAGYAEWKGLQSLGLVVSQVTRDGKETVELRYYLSSLPVGVKRFAQAVRSHWAIENTCHWCLDVTFREDDSRIREKHVRENMGWLNRVALSLLKQHPRKTSIAMKRRSCGWNDAFLLEVLTGTKA